jgi:hypothetical protein
MKKKIEVEIDACDFCNDDDDTYEKCLGCGKHVCYDCQETVGVRMTHGVYFRGSDDGFYCNSCLNDDKVVSTPLYRAYQKIAFLRTECENWNKGFKERMDSAEAELESLLERSKK